MLNQATNQQARLEAEDEASTEEINLLERPANSVQESTP
jgi:hypothetical protein